MIVECNKKMTLETVAYEYQGNRVAIVPALMGDNNVVDAPPVLRFSSKDWSDELSTQLEKLPETWMVKNYA
eukprot:m.18714 g.18714  ORF g.18714 m.18714 type:complete len:71 (+) comp12170_c0_seq1:1206-1418(+)